MPERPELYDESVSVEELEPAAAKRVRTPPPPPPRGVPTAKQFSSRLKRRVARGTDRPPSETMFTPAPVRRKLVSEERRKTDSPFSPSALARAWTMYRSENSYDAMTSVDKLDFEGVAEFPISIGGSVRHVRFCIKMTYLAKGLRIIDNEGEVICDLFKSGPKRFKMHEVLAHGREEDRASTAKSAIFSVAILRYIQKAFAEPLGRGETI